MKVALGNSPKGYQNSWRFSAEATSSNSAGSKPGVKLIFTEGHINIMVALKEPVGTCRVALKGPLSIELTTIIYATLMLKQHLCDVLMVMLQ